MFAHYSGVFESCGKPVSRLLRETAVMEFTVISFVCFIRAAEFGVPDLFFPSRFCALQEEGCLLASEKNLSLPSCKVKANITGWSLLTMISDCEVYPVLTLLT